jgi:2'-hydroxyisoflavone reductase
MKLLILGGTMFLGRHLVDAALARGHEVTLFNRGVNNAALYPELEKLRGDRSGDLATLQGRSWDAVIDTCGYLPSQVQAAAGLLADVVRHYTYISSLSVYPEFSRPGIDETTPLPQLTNDQAAALSKIKDLTPALAEKLRPLYGPLKVLCERVAEEAMPGRVLTIRPGLVVGPWDYHESFTCWVRRIAKGGEVLAPGRPNRPVQLIDARDLAEWTIRLIEVRQSGQFNATGPDYSLTLQQLLKECVVACGSNARLVWVDDQFLVNASATRNELPIWHPDPRTFGLAAVNCGKAIASGLTFRPIGDTIQDTLEWDNARPANLKRPLGIRLDRESQLLQAWHYQSLGYHLQST